MRRGLLALSVFLVPLSAGAQCLGNLGAELDGLSRYSASILGSPVIDTVGIKRDVVIRRVKDEAAFIRGVAAAGASAGCLRDKFEAFSKAALAEFAVATDTFSVEAVRAALARASAAALAERYQTADRFGVVIGVGVGAIIQANDADSYKIVSRRPPQNDSVVLADTLFIVKEGDSKVLPHLSTGVMVRFRERERDRERLHSVINFLLPTSFFASAQLSAQDGPINGAILGLGWQVTGGASLTLGYSAARGTTLRDDLLVEFNAEPTRRLALPSGESPESIKGTHVVNAWVFALAFPVGFRAALSQ